jgi:NitT/TauT family transport system substrate-binding protein
MMGISVWWRRVAIKFGAALIVASAGLTLGLSPGRAQDKVVIYTNWFAEPEHGGFYQAVATGIYKKYGLDVDLHQGGPQLNTSILLLGGKADFVLLHDVNEVLNAVQENEPMITVAAIYQKDPQVIMTHKGTGHDGINTLKGSPIVLSQDAMSSFWLWMKAKYGYTDDQARPYTGQLAPFLTHKDWGQQAYITGEPAMVRATGEDPNVYMLADYGWNPYCAPFVTRTDLVKKNPDLVRRVVQATIEGWYSYFNDPTPGNLLIKKLASGQNDKIIANSLMEMRKNGIVVSGDALTLGIGAMTDKRWKDFFQVTVETGIHKPDLDYKKGYTLAFVDDPAFIAKMKAEYPNAIKNATGM